MKNDLALLAEHYSAAVTKQQRLTFARFMSADEPQRVHARKMVISALYVCVVLAARELTLTYRRAYSA